MTGRLNSDTSNTVFQIISQMDRIVIRLHQYGISPEDIAMIVNSSEEMINARIRRIEKTLDEFGSFVAMDREKPGMGKSSGRNLWK